MQKEADEQDDGHSRRAGCCRSQAPPAPTCCGEGKLGPCRCRAAPLAPLLLLVLARLRLAARNAAHLGPLILHQRIERRLADRRPARRPPLDIVAVPVQREVAALLLGRRKAGGASHADAAGNACGAAAAGPGRLLRCRFGGGGGGGGAQVQGRQGCCRQLGCIVLAGAGRQLVQGELKQRGDGSGHSCSALQAPCEPAGQLSIGAASAGYAQFNAERHRSSLLSTPPALCPCCLLKSTRSPSCSHERQSPQHYSGKHLRHSSPWQALGTQTRQTQGPSFEPAELTGSPSNPS